MKKLLSGDEVAKIIGLSPRRVRAMLENGQIRADRVGRAYAVSPYSLIGLRVFGKSGRPAPGEFGKEITKADVDSAFLEGGVLYEDPKPQVAAQEAASQAAQG